MTDDTRLDRSVRWFKNNPVFSVLMLGVLAVVGASQLVGALSNLASAGKDLSSANTPATPITSPEHHDLGFSAEYGAKGSGPGYSTRQGISQSTAAVS